MNGWNIYFFLFPLSIFRHHYESYVDELTLFFLCAYIIDIRKSDKTSAKFWRCEVFKYGSAFFWRRINLILQKSS